MKVFYHIDNDGKCAAFWVRELAKHTDDYDIEYLKINYGMEFPFDAIRKNEQVFIVDYSIMPEEMDRLLEITNDIVWIDHHASSIKRYEGYHKKIKGVRYDGVAGCMLTYCYLKHMEPSELPWGMNERKPLPFDISMTEDAPMFTKLIADYDVWTFEYGAATREFALGLEMTENDPESEMWYGLLYTGDYGKPLADIKAKGRVIIDYRSSWAADYCKHKGFETELDGYKCFALNLAMVSSDDFDSVDAEQYDMFIGFSYDGKSWNYSLRSTKVNCAEVAMKYGGGGHAGAAGFNSDDLLLKALNQDRTS